jgi:hypothetical protein
MSFPYQWMVTAAYERQQKRCGLCGAWLPSVYWEAHHANGHPHDHRVANCVILCGEPPRECHLTAHFGRMHGPDVIRNKDYKYWYG